MSASVLQEAVAGALATGTTAATPAFAAMCTIGSTIEVWVGAGGISVPASVADSASQSYTLQGSVHNAHSGSTLSLWTLENNQSATALTITATFSASATNCGAWAKEIGGVTASPLQGTPTLVYLTTPGTGVNAITTGSITPTTQPLVMSALVMCANAAVVATDTAAIAGDTGWTNAGHANGRSESYQLTSTAATAANFTDSTNGATGYYLVGAALYTGSGLVSQPILSGGKLLISGGHIITGALFLPIAWTINRRNKLAQERRSSPSSLQRRR